MGFEAGSPRPKTMWEQCSVFLARRFAKLCLISAMLSLTLLSISLLGGHEKLLSYVSSPNTKPPHPSPPLPPASPPSPITNPSHPFPPLPPADDAEYIAICIGVRDQSADLAEWFKHYYHHHGIRRFYLIDDGSLPPLASKPADYYGIPPSAITHSYVPRSHRPKQIQNYMYEEKCIKPYQDMHTWMGFLDADEFIEMRHPKTLQEWLRDWDRNASVGAVAASWLTHNSAGHETRPEGDARKAFQRCITNDDPRGDNKHNKMFAKTLHISTVHSVHHIGTEEGTLQVDEHGEPTGGVRYPPSQDLWAIHHYGIKSREQFEEKRARNKALDWPTADDLFERINGFESYECPELAAYVP